FFQAEDGIRAFHVTGVQTCALPISRNLVTDRLRRGRVVSIEPVGDPGSLNVLIDEVTPERRLDAHQVLRRLAAAFDRLPPRCRRSEERGGGYVGASGEAWAR